MLPFNSNYQMQVVLNLLQELEQGSIGLDAFIQRARESFPVMGIPDDKVEEAVRRTSIGHFYFDLYTITNLPPGPNLSSKANFLGFLDVNKQNAADLIAQYPDMDFQGWVEKVRETLSVQAKDLPDERLHEMVVMVAKVGLWFDATANYTRILPDDLFSVRLIPPSDEDGN